MKNTTAVNYARHNKGGKTMNGSNHPLSRKTSPEIQKTKPKLEMQRTVSTRRNEGEEKANKRARGK